MALLFIEGFDYLSTASGLVDSVSWSTSNISSYGTLGTGRFGYGQALELFDDNSYIQVDTGLNTNEGIIGFAMFNHTDTGSIVGGEFVRILDSGNNENLTLNISSGGHISIRRYQGATTRLMGMSDKTLHTGVWNYIEFKFFCDQTVGYVEVRVNGEEWINETGLDSVYSLSNWKTVRFYGDDADVSYDDIYIADDSTGTVTDFLGDVEVQTSYPATETATIQWTPSTGTDNAALVDDPLNDLDDVSSSTNGHEDLYNCDTLDTHIDSVYGVMAVIRASKDDTGTRTIAVRSSSGANEQTSSDIGMGTALEYHHRLFTESDSGGSTVWTPALFDAADFGIKVTS